MAKSRIKTRIKLSHALPVLALAAAAVAPMPQALRAASPTALAQGAANRCAPGNPCAPSGAKKKAKAGNPCAPAAGKSKKKSANPCAPN